MEPFILYVLLYAIWKAVSMYPFLVTIKTNLYIKTIRLFYRGRQLACPNYIRVVLTRLFFECLSVVRPYERGYCVALYLALDEEVGVFIRGLLGGCFEF